MIFSLLKIHCRKDPGLFPPVIEMRALWPLLALMRADDSPCTSKPTPFHRLCVNNESIAVHCFLDGAKQPMSIEVRPHWDPVGARRFLHLIETNGLEELGFTTLSHNKHLVTFEAEGEELQTDGFKPKGLPKVPAAGGLIGYCSDSALFYFVRPDHADAEVLGLPFDCHTPFAEVVHGHEGFAPQEGSFKKCVLPETQVHCATTKGGITIQLHPFWAPIGVARYLALVKAGFYTNLALHRVNSAIIQFGAASEAHRKKFEHLAIVQIADDSHIKDPTIPANPEKGLPRFRLAFAGAPVPNSRDAGTFFVHHPSGRHLGAERWEAGCGDVVNGKEVIDKIYNGYGESVNVQLLYTDEAAFKKKYPKLDYINECSIVTQHRKRKSEF